ncbi:MAG: hypothetical protein WC742_02390 [Gallionellaceae bacterium]|jgi:hypothetical protein
MSPLTTRLFLGLTLLLAIAAAIFALSGIYSGQKEAWATLAGALAVVTSMVSAWGAQRVIELEEQKLEPYPNPQFDATSEYGLMLLKITNFGGGAAHNIKLVWDKPLKNSHGKEIRFSSDSKSGELSILVPGQHISKFIDGHIQFFQIEGPHIYGGSVEYQDSKGRKKSHRFLLDAEALKGTSSYEEGNKTHHELQKLPDRLQELCNEVKKISSQLERH